MLGQWLGWVWALGLAELLVVLLQKSGEFV